MGIQPFLLQINIQASPFTALKLRSRHISSCKRCPLRTLFRCYTPRGGTLPWWGCDVKIYISPISSARVCVQSWAGRSRPTGHRWAVSWQWDLATDISSVLTSGHEYDNSTTRTDPPPAAAPLSICHKLNNNVLSPQACNNTCWRDQELANAFNNQSPRVPFYPDNRPKSAGQHHQCKSHPNPSDLTPSFFLPFISPFAQGSFYLNISLSLLFPPGSFRCWINRFFAFFSTLLPFSGLFVVVASWDLSVRYETNIACTSGTTSGLERVPAAWNRSPIAAFTCTRPSSVFLKTFGNAGSR